MLFGSRTRPQATYSACCSLRNVHPFKIDLIQCCLILVIRQEEFFRHNLIAIFQLFSFPLLVYSIFFFLFTNISFIFSFRFASWHFIPVIYFSILYHYFSSLLKYFLCISFFLFPFYFFFHLFLFTILLSLLLLLLSSSCLSHDFHFNLLLVCLLNFSCR